MLNRNQYIETCPFGDQSNYDFSLISFTHQQLLILYQLICYIRCYIRLTPKLKYHYQIMQQTVKQVAREFKDSQKISDKPKLAKKITYVQKPIQIEGFAPHAFQHASTKFISRIKLNESENDGKEKKSAPKVEESSYIPMVPDLLLDLNQHTPKLDKLDGESNPKRETKKTFIYESILAFSEEIDEEHLGIKTQTKQIRKLFLEVYEFAQRRSLVIKRCLHSPFFFFQYTNSQSKEKEQKLFRDLIRSKKNIFQRSPELITVLFQRLYERVDPKYFGIAIFGIEKAKKSKVPINRRTVFNQKNLDQQLMFYYARGSDGHLNFTLIDKFCHVVDFTSNFIFQNAGLHPAEFHIYQKMKINIEKGASQAQQGLNMFGNQQIESDQQVKSFEEENLEELHNQYNRLMEKDFNELKEEQKSIELKIKQIAADNEGDKQKLLQQLQQIQLNLHNYSQVIKRITQKGSQIQQNGHFLSKQFFKTSIKKIIIAERQLKSRLPIIGKKGVIMKLLQSNQQLIIIEGETGSGKSTQLPQILCEFYKLLDNRKSKPVLVTQPRRLAVRSLAERVAFELGEKRVGEFVDYKNSADKQINERAKIVFKLDRLVLDELTEDPLLSKYSCLVIDEAHERTISIDVILGLVKGLLNDRKDFKIIVTSASMDIQLFERYFSEKALKISGRLHDVEVIYKNYDDVDSNVEKIKKVLNEEIFEENLCLKHQFKGHILVFCNGVDQINRLAEIYQAKLNPNQFLVFMLHGKVAPEDQKKAFQQCKQHKIIFASRIAQTAITIDGVRVVIDPGEDIQMVYDQKYKFSSMKNRKISQSSAKQRAGRAGRTAPGFCFRLYSEASYKERPLGKLPEMDNSSLDTVVLRLKSLKIKDVINFSYISRPDKQGLFASIQNLKMIGGLDEQQTITVIGELLIKIPIEPMLSRSIVQSILTKRILLDAKFLNFHMKQMPIQKARMLQSAPIVEDVVQILCMIVNCSSLFRISQENQNIGDFQKFQKFADPEGDFFFLKNIYSEFKRLIKSQGQKSEKISIWLRQHFISKKALKQVMQLEREIMKIVECYKLIHVSKFFNELDDIKVKLRQCSIYNEIVLGCLITSFCPNICLYSGNPQIGYTMIAQKRPIQIYGTSTLALLNLTPKWIISYDLYTSEKGRFYCKIAQQIEFSSLKSMTSKYVWQKLQLAKAQHINPFYEFVEHVLPTKIYHCMKQAYLRNLYDQKKNVWSSEYEEQMKKSFIFNDEFSKVTIYFLKDGQNNQNWNQIYQKYYQQKIYEFAMACYIHPYYANTRIIYVHGLSIANIQKINQSDLVINGIPEVELSLFKHQILLSISQNIQIQIFEKQKRIKINSGKEDINKRIIKQLQLFLQEKKYKKQVKIRQIPRNIRKMSQQKVLLIFFAGQRNALSPAFIYFGPPMIIKILRSKYQEFKQYYELVDYKKYIKQRQKQDKDDEIQVIDIKNSLAYKMKQLLCEAVIKFNNKQFKIEQQPLKLSLNYKHTGIKWASPVMDEYELQDFIQMLQKEHYLQNYIKPKFIKHFRDISPLDSLKSDSQWKKEIQNLLKQVGVQFEDCTINLWKKGEYRNNQSQKVEINIFAQISSFTGDIFQKMKIFDNKSQKLGSDKLHIRHSYDQILGFPSTKTFKMLINQYENAVNIIKEKHSHLIIEEKSVSFKKSTKIMILGKSCDRSALIDASKIISSIFEPNIIELEEKEHKLLELINKNSILDELEYQYLNKIYFMYDKKSRNIKVYCSKELFPEIVKKLKQFLKAYQYYNYIMSYKGKDLSKVVQILDERKRENAQKGGIPMEYDIWFNRKEICIYTKCEEYLVVKHRVDKLSSSDLFECQLCQGKLHFSYILLNCFHYFCRVCLSGYIKTSVAQNAPYLECPNSHCSQSINIYDIELVVGEETFLKLCDQRFVQYTKQKKEISICSNCLLVVWDAETKDDSECDFCGHGYCFKCKTDHKGQNCNTYQQKSKDSMKRKRGQKKMMYVSKS